MLNRIVDGVTWAVRLFMWLGFAAMIATVALQVVARNILQTSFIWTGDVAQLLFAWLIFIGAAVGLRVGAHYRVDMIPDGRPAMQRAAEIIALAAGVCVALILLIQGWQLAQVRASADVQSLGISRFWMFAPMPVSGALMLLYLAEMVIAPREGVRP
ncbi:TRAP transporter small permease [Roseicyclus sp. F158]|uniref:TRAP transporter small permease protein n=1 Tax=Tropicimonas omnivorans TaxID=3075590 RepID=A0ABU3DKW2_9RHOB|nr:TRAP transporter small permease [Roseicyclus sp. F158]MDT0684353.1 TRAP transporter small permease [Roseicyclus sp. F158]